jgi:ankyrin repeat protein
VTDSPTYKLSIDVDGHAKEVTDYVGSWVGMPQVITELEDAVDTLAQTERWIAGETGMVQALRNAKFNFHTHAAQAILKEAARSGNAGTVQALLDAGVPLTPLPVFDPKQRENGPPESLGWLQAAIMKPQVLRVLMEAGASSSDQTDKDMALVRAVFFAQVESARALIAYGANPNADLSTLGVHGGVPNEATEARTILIDAAKSRNPEMVREILRYHPRLEARDAKGRTAIFAALQSYHHDEDKNRAIAECVRLLAEAGADVNARDNDGNTPLHTTSFLDVAEELLKLGADVNARNNDGETPIFTTGNDDVIVLFIEHGADLTIRNNAGRTVMETRQEALRKAMQSVSERKSVVSN